MNNYPTPKMFQGSLPAGAFSLPKPMPGALADPSINPSWYRQDGSRKGMGFLGPLKFHDGSTSTELSIGVNLGGKEVSIPLLVPTLDKAEIQHLMSGGNPTEITVQKAVEHARQRMMQGLSPFKE